MATGPTRPKNTQQMNNFVAYEDSDWCCSVCNEKFRDVRTLPCGHFICGPLAHPCIRMVLDFKQRKCQVEGCGKVIDEDFDPDKSPRPKTAKKQQPTRNTSPTPSIYAQNDDSDSRQPEEKNCKKHKKVLEFYCIKCNVSICRKGWNDDHKDTSKHQVVLFQFILEPQSEVRDRIQEYRNECEQTSRSIMNNFNIFLKDVRDLQDKHVNVMKSKNNEELQKRADVVKKEVEKQKISLKKLKNEITEQLERIDDKLTNLLKTKIATSKEVRGNEEESNKKLSSMKTKAGIASQSLNGLKTERRILKCMRTEFVIEEEIGCIQAVYNTSTQLLMCFDFCNKQVHSIRVNGDLKSLTAQQTLDWKKVRKDEGSELFNIGMTSDNTLYGCIFNKNVNENKWRVSVLSESDLREERRIDTSIIREQNREQDCYWHLSGCGDKLAIVSMLHNESDKVYRWESVYIYREEKCIERVRIDIGRDQYSSRLCYIGSHLILQTSDNTVAIVPLDRNGSVTQGNKDSNTEENKKKTKSDKEQLEQLEEESRVSSEIKHITLLDTGEICELVWLERDEQVGDDHVNEVMIRKREQSSADGYLFVGDYTINKNECSVYELDLNIVKDGDQVRSRKDLEMKEVFPKCIIDNSTLFAINGIYFHGEPSIIRLEFD